jgi:hypothetical protein
MGSLVARVDESLPWLQEKIKSKQKIGKIFFILNGFRSLIRKIY